MFIKYFLQYNPDVAFLNSKKPLKASALRDPILSSSLFIQSIRFIRANEKHTCRNGDKCQKSPLINANGVSNKNDHRNDTPCLSHNPGVKYSSFGFTKAPKFIVLLYINKNNIGK